MLHLSFRMKIMICCIGLVALLDLIVVLFVRNELADTLGGEYLAKGRNTAVNLAARSERLVLVEDFVSLLQLVKDLKESDEDIAYAYVADRKGRVLAHTFAGGFPHDLAGINALAPEVTSKRELLDTIEEGLVHDIAVPILHGKVGSVHVGISERRIQHTIARFTLVLVAIALFVLMVAVGLSIVVSDVVTRPVRNLIRAARKIRDGDLNQRLAATTKDEIGELVESFNQMSDELLKQHGILQDRNRRIRMTQEQAAWERDKLRAIIDSMVEGLIFVDAESKIALCNQSAERIWGTSAPRIVGKSVEACAPGDLRSKLREILEQAGQKPGFAETDSLELHNGHCLITYAVVHGEDGRYLGLVFLSLDISNRVALEQEQKQLRNQLFQQEKMAMIGQIAAGVAHELNTPLGTILLRAQMVRRQMGNSGDLSDLKVVENEAQRCRGIIDSLLSFSRRSKGALSRRNVDSLISECLSLIENDLTLKGVQLQTDCLGDGALICADANQIQQVLLNVVTNAADAMPHGGRLQIVTRLLSDQNMIEICVTDDGDGMTEDVLKQAFEPFFTTKGPGKGTGLGLPICRRIIEEHKGKIEIQSRPGQGTTVLIRLPNARTEVPARA